MAEENAQAGEKKIIIDEDWKAQVQAEKERAAEPKKEESPPPLLTASISLLFTLLANQALISLGALPNPATNKAEIDRDQARYFTDLLGVLEEKTRNNLSPDEKKQLDALLFELRMLYVQSQPNTS